MLWDRLVRRKKKQSVKLWKVEKKRRWRRKNRSGARFAGYSHRSGRTAPCISQRPEVSRAFLSPRLRIFYFFIPPPLFFRKGNTFYRDFWGYYIQSTSPFAHALHQLLHKIVSQCRVTKGEGHLAGKLYRNQNGGEKKKLRNDNGNQMSLYIVMERSGKVLEIKFIFY